jgi:hypothetical protein
MNSGRRAMTSGWPGATSTGVTGTNWVVTVSMVVLLAVLWLAPAPVIQVAMLDAIGASRGSDGRELAALRQTWTKAVVASFELP